MSLSSKREAAIAAVDLFRERSTFWSASGYAGADLYDRLATDPILPEYLHPFAIAVLEGVRPDAIAARRKRGGGSSFVRTAQNAILYPTSDYCRFLAARFVERRLQPAQGEYTNAAP
jgi:hypothetical protein